MPFAPLRRKNMAKHGKKFQALAKLVDEEKLYTVEEAIALVKETAKAKFDESVEVAFKLALGVAWQ